MVKKKKKKKKKKKNQVNNEVNAFLELYKINYTNLKKSNQKQKDCV